MICSMMGLGLIASLVQWALMSAVSFQSLQVSNQVFVHYRYYPAVQPRGVVIVLHGIQSHSGWYEKSCSVLAANGYVVYAPDRRGSGLNQRDRGDIDSWETLVEDVSRFVALARNQHPGVPVFVQGISWGGKLALLYAGLNPGEVAGLILSTPGIVPQVDVSLGDKGEILWGVMHDRYGTVQIPIDQAEAFTSNPRWLEFIRSDPLTLRRCTYRFFWNDKQITRELPKACGAYTGPILLLLAGHDLIVDNARTVEFLARRLPSPSQVQQKTYANAWHTLEFETDITEYVRDMVAWLNERTR
jgi:alpha-beta hydrolase superfamily lysophospholipase